jgi:hypothetical protein
VIKVCLDLLALTLLRKEDSVMPAFFTQNPNLNVLYMLTLTLSQALIKSAGKQLRSSHITWMKVCRDAKNQYLMH